jgi:rod shape determining protein RodA
MGRMRWWHLLVYLVILALPIMLIIEQPDLGTAVVVTFCALIILLMSRFPWWLWLLLLSLAFISTPLVWHQLKPYQKQRIETFLHPERDPNRTGYNVRQAEIAVGSGGMFGRGLGRGSQSQLNFLPVAHTDFIFSGYAEATGYIGSLFLLAVFGCLLWRSISIAEISGDQFGRLLAVGITAMFAVQILVNIGMNIRLLPVTGIPLPFISYGGTSLFINMIALGLLESIVLRHKKINFDTTP